MNIADERDATSAKPGDTGGTTSVMGLRLWFLHWVGDPFTPERATEKLRAIPDRAEARKILRGVKRNAMYADDFRGLKL
jgi:hypothetical protein